MKKSLLLFNAADDAWIRKCNECGHKQEDKKPIGEMSDAYRNRKCKRCKSEALDFGRLNASTVDESEED